MKKTLVYSILALFAFTLWTQGSVARAQPATSQSSGLPLLMITFFDPFDGASVNNSNFVAQALQEKLKENYEVHLCNLPVVYDQDFEAAKQCISQLGRKPNLIFSLGEGSPCGQVNLETLTQNLDNESDEDNAHQVHENRIILPNEPSSKKISFLDSDIQTILSGIPQIQLSTDMGNYVCNNIAFHMVSYLESLSAPKIPYTFLHVPPHDCFDGFSVDDAASAIARLMNNPATRALAQP